MLMDVDVAVARLGKLARPVVETETVDLEDGFARALAEDVLAPVDLPPFDASAMDGYAVRSDSLGERSRRWRIVGESLAGHPAAAQVTPGTAVRIFTGAVLPDGADAVVLQEDVVRDGEFALSEETVEAGQNVRRRGHDVRRGSVLVRAGKRLGTYDLTWLAACGIDRVRVRRRIRVAVFSTGDELVERGRLLAPGQIYDSNRFALAALLREKAATVTDLGLIADDLPSIRKTLLEAAQADVVVTSGGVSVGDADYVKAAVEDVGSLDFWRIALKPGKPLAVGCIGDALFFGLPGNPVSTIVTYLLFVAAAVDRLSGVEPLPLLRLPATLEHFVRHSPGRREYMRGTLTADADRLRVAATGDQGSNRLATLAHANCLILIDERSGNLEAGDNVQVIPLSAEASHPLREPRRG